MASAAPVKAISPATDVPQVLSAGTTFSLTQSARSMDFNEDWTFSLNPSGNDATLSAAGFDDSAWRTLNLPHDWSIEQDFTNQVSSEIGHLPGGTGWYRKSFVLPAELQGKRINIDFDGVYMDSHIWVNGKKVGNYPNGYIPFSFDVTDYEFVMASGKCHCSQGYKYHPERQRRKSVEPLVFGQRYLSRCAHDCDRSGACCTVRYGSFHTGYRQ